MITRVTVYKLAGAYRQLEEAEKWIRLNAERISELSKKLETLNADKPRIQEEYQAAVQAVCVAQAELVKGAAALEQAGSDPVAGPGVDAPGDINE